MPNKRIAKIPKPDGSYDRGEELDFEILEEGWSKYKASDGTIIRARIVASKILRLLKKDNEIKVGDDGVPQYNLRYNIVIAADAQEEATP